MYPGACIGGVSHGLFQSRSVVERENGREILIRIPDEQFLYLRILRSESFTQDEVEFLAKFAKIVHDVAARGNAPDVSNFSSRSIREAIAGVAMNGSKTFFNALELVQVWNDKAYEGRPIRTAYGFNPDAFEHTGIHLETFFRDDYGPVLSNGRDTLLEFTDKGFLVRHNSLSKESAAGFSPDVYSPVAAWAWGRRVALVTTEFRETLVFHERRLAFARRRGQWHQISHDYVFDKLCQFDEMSSQLCNALHETILDASFAHTGACISVMNRARCRHEKRRTSDVTHEDEWLASSKDRKARCFSSLIAGRPFFEIPRRLRQELAALDGALILDSDGIVRAVGAIVQIDPKAIGGGGRVAAARTLAQFGLAVCISCDGRVTGFSRIDDAAEPEAVFAFG